MGALGCRGATTRGVCYVRDRLPMIGRGGILPPSKCVGSLRRHAVGRTRSRRRDSTLGESVPSRWCGVVLGRLGPALRRSRVVSRPPVDVPIVEWFLGLDDRNRGVARAPFGDCGFPPLVRGRGDVFDQGVAWYHGSFRGRGTQREVGPSPLAPPFFKKFMVIYPNKSLKTLR